MWHVETRFVFLLQNYALEAFISQKGLDGFQKDVAKSCTDAADQLTNVMDSARTRVLAKLKNGDIVFPLSSKIRESEFRELLN